MDTTPPGPDVSKGPLLIGITVLFHVISLGLFASRIYTRIKPQVRLGVDDLLLTLAVLFDLTEWVLLLIGIHYGVGRHNYYVDPQDSMQAEKFLFISQPPYAWALAFAKMSIVWMLLRILRDRRFLSMFLYFMLVCLVLLAVTMNAFQFSLCKPLSAIWDHSIPNPVCMDPSISQTSIYVTAALTIVSDVVLSLLPITFIIHIQRPLREKIALGFVMSLGIFASVASIAKTTLVRTYGITGDDLMDSVGITIWSILEMQLAIIASCIPTLKTVFEKFLRRVGLMSSTYGSGARSGYYAQNSGTNHHLKQMRMSKNETHKTLSDDAESDLGPKAAYFKTGVKSSATHVDSNGSQELIISPNAQGIQMETSISIRTSSKMSVDDSPL